MERASWTSRSARVMPMSAAWVLTSVQKPSRTAWTRLPRSLGSRPSEGVSRAEEIEALFGEGAEATCSLGLKDGSSALVDAIRRGRNGRFVGEGVECDRRGLLPGGAMRQGSSARPPRTGERRWGPSIDACA